MVCLCAWCALTHFNRVQLWNLHDSLSIVLHVRFCFYMLIALWWYQCVSCTICRRVCVYMCNILLIFICRWSINKKDRQLLRTTVRHGVRILVTFAIWLIWYETEGKHDDNEHWHIHIWHKLIRHPHGTACLSYPYSLKRSFVVLSFITVHCSIGFRY